MGERTLRGKVAIAGVGETTYYKHGKSPDAEFKLCLIAILAACDLEWVEVAGRGRIFSWERPYHPVHPALNGHGPYVVVLVELPEAGGVRMVGNLLGDPLQPVTIGVLPQ